MNIQLDFRPLQYENLHSQFLKAMSNKNRYRYNGVWSNLAWRNYWKMTFDRIKPLTVTTSYCSHHIGDCAAHIETTENTGKNNMKVRAFGI